MKSELASPVSGGTGWAGIQAGGIAGTKAQQHERAKHVRDKLPRVLAGVRKGAR